MASLGVSKPVLRLALYSDPGPVQRSQHCPVPRIRRRVRAVCLQLPLESTPTLKSGGSLRLVASAAGLDAATSEYRNVWARGRRSSPRPAAGRLCGCEPACFRLPHPTSPRLLLPQCP